MRTESHGFVAEQVPIQGHFEEALISDEVLYMIELTGDGALHSVGRLGGPMSTTTLPLGNADMNVPIIGPACDRIQYQGVARIFTEVPLGVNPQPWLTLPAL